MTPYALDCGACRGGGWVGDTMCESCGGVGKILVGTKPEVQSRWPRVLAWVIVLGLAIFAAWLLVKFQ